MTNKITVVNNIHIAGRVWRFVNFAPIAIEGSFRSSLSCGQERSPKSTSQHNTTVRQ
ncbi:MAG: hypothetical protein IPF54_08780 [Draconibacterium sp.]|nr:hypothetical protein [Draconibacterium sp.]